MYESGLCSGELKACYELLKWIKTSYALTSFARGDWMSSTYLDQRIDYSLDGVALLPNPAYTVDFDPAFCMVGDRSADDYGYIVAHIVRRAQVYQNLGQRTESDLTVGTPVNFTLY